MSIPYHRQHLGSPARGGEGGSCTGILMAWSGGGVTQFGIPNARGFSSEIPKGGRWRKLSLKSLI